MAPGLRFFFSFCPACRAPRPTTPLTKLTEMVSASTISSSVSSSGPGSVRASSSPRMLGGRLRGGGGGGRADAAAAADGVAGRGLCPRRRPASRGRSGSGGMGGEQLLDGSSRWVCSGRIGASGARRAGPLLERGGEERRNALLCCASLAHTLAFFAHPLSPTLVPFMSAGAGACRHLPPALMHAASGWPHSWPHTLGRPWKRCAHVCRE